MRQHPLASDVCLFGGMMKKLILTVTLTVASMTAMPALAQDVEGPVTLSANVALVSDYRFRGVSLSGKDPAIQGGFDVATRSGFYAGAWGSSIEQYNGAETELDFYGGWSGDVGGLTLNVGAIGLVYPDGRNTNYYELYSTATKEVGPVGATLSLRYSPEQDNLGDMDNLYVGSDFSYVLPQSPVTLKAHLGYEDGALGGPDGDKFDWSLGADVTYRQFTLGVAYVDTDARNWGLAKAGVVVSLAARF